MQEQTSKMDYKKTIYWRQPEDPSSSFWQQDPDAGRSDFLVDASVRQPPQCIEEENWDFWLWHAQQKSAWEVEEEHQAEERRHFV